MPPKKSGSSPFRNIGPFSQKRLAEIGVRTMEDLQKIGPVEAYIRIKQHYPEDTTLLLLYALKGALMEIHWNAVPRKIKERLRAEAEAMLPRPNCRGSSQRAKRA
jgi:DNA transformation protein